MSNIYNSKYFCIFIVPQKIVRNGYCGLKWCNLGEKDTKVEKGQRALKLYMFREECNYFCNFLFVNFFFKYVLSVEISSLEPKSLKCFFCKCFLIKHFILKLLQQTWHLQLNLHDFSSEKEIFRQCRVKSIAHISRRSKTHKYTCKTSTWFSCICHVCVKSFEIKCYFRKHLQKETPYTFCFQVQDFHISDVFYKIQNFNKWKRKAIVSFLPRNLKLYSS